MSFQDCLGEVEAAIGRKLSTDEAIKIFEDTQAREKYIKANAALGDIDAAIRNAADETAKQLIRAAKIEKRNAFIAYTKRSEVLDFIKSQFAEKPEAGLEAILNGVNTAKVGSRDSAAARQHTFLAEWLSGFVHDLESSNVLHILTSGEFDKELSRALNAIDNPSVGEYKGLSEVKTAAGVINKWQEVVRNKYNDHGAAVDKMEGYIIKQSHDQDKIRRAGLEAWKASIMDKLDINKTFDATDNVSDVLTQIYNNFVSGSHMKTKDEITGFKGGTLNLAKKASADRVLHFKDADSWYDYHQEFGVGTISDSILYSMRNAAQNIGLMSKLGPNPRDNYNRVVEYIKSSLRKDPEKLASFNEATKRGGYLDNRFSEVDGTSRIAVDGMLARIGSTTRAVESMSKLGGALVSSFADLSTIMSEMRYQGHDPFAALGESVAGLAQGKSGAALKEVEAGLGIITDSMRGELSGARSFAEDNLPGVMSKLQMMFFKLNGLTWWTDSLRSTSIRMMSHLSAMNKHLPFEQLSSELQRVYGLYGIDAGKWDIIRNTVTKAADGREYIVPSAIADMPNAVFEKYLTDNGKTVTPLAIRDLKDEVKTQFSAYFHDRADFAVLQPDAQTRAIITQGTQPGTPVGELLRFMGQFKAFPVAYVQKVLGRETFGRGADASAGLIDALKNGNGEVSGLAQQFIWATLFGYASYNAKDLLKGRTTKQPESAADYAKILQASMLQGGGLGLLGDYMFGEMKNRYGAGPLTGMMGPTFATAESVLDIYGRAKNGDDLGGAALRTVINNTPFANLFYTKAALDYLVVYRLQEQMNPGYLSRMEGIISKEQGKTFLFPPSQYAR